MKILITGATGFLGSTLTGILRGRGDDVTSLSSKVADLRDPRSLDGFSSTKFDRIFHLAAWTQAGDFCLYHQGEQWIMNQKINTTVVSWWAERQPQAKMISIGTSCTYPLGASLKEELYLEGSPIEDLYVYAMTKRMLQVGLMSMNKQFGMKYLTVVPSTLYGPGYHTSNRQMHFIFDLIRKILRYKYYGERIVLWGDGFQSREIVFVEDFVNTMLALDGIVENEIVNIGAGREFPIRTFAELICGIVGVDPGVITYDTSKYVGAKSKGLDIGKLQRLLPGRETTDMRKGLETTIAWMEEKLFPEHTENTLSR